MLTREILLVEDDPIAQLTIRNALLAVDPDINVTCVSSADGAYEALAQGARLKGPAFDMVISDVLFPTGPDGVDLWRYCRERYPWLDFLAVSAMPFDEFFSRYRSSNEWPPFLAKPVSSGELRQVFENMYTPWGFQS